MGGRSYVKGGMGEVSQAAALAAQSFGAKILTKKTMKRVIVKDGSAKLCCKTKSWNEYLG
jgi:phytoene dehydrogenase-like protein